MTPTIRRIAAVAGAVAFAGLLSPLAARAAAQEATVPSVREVLFAIREVSVSLDQLLVRSAIDTEEGGGALLQLPDGTLVDVQLVEVTGGWSVRNFYFVAGNADSYRSWTRPWRDRVEAAGRFLAAARETALEGQMMRTARELAPLVWFEDPEESTRLWGLNPVTFRMMQALRLVPMGPMSSGAERRRQQQ